MPSSVLLKAFVAFAFVGSVVQSCSNIIVSSGASADSSNIVAYNADAATVYGVLYHYPASTHSSEDLREVYDWDTGKYLGQIKEAEKTFNVVGNINEHGVIIGETTYGGIASLQAQTGAKIDYGSLIWITLQRASSAREAIKIIDELMNENGYASEGESFSIADQKEAWIMEIIGKGDYEKGAVWVARKVPEGHICAHANQARITTFPRHDPDTLYAKDVVSFARKIGLYPANAREEDFSFSDVYDPVTYSGARICDARVWAVFGEVMGPDWSAQYLDYALGQNLTNRMPLFVKPEKKISVADTMHLMRSHFEESQLDMTGISFPDVGAAYSASPYRAHPLTWYSKANGDGTVSADYKAYMHERPIATPQTGWNFVAQSRRWMPNALSGLLWFGVDDSSTTVHFPVYGSATRVSQAFGGKGPQDGVTPPMMTFDIQKAFYAFNVVANWAYTRWDLIYPDVLKEILSREAAFTADIVEVDKRALTLLKEKGEASAVEYVTDFSVQAGNKLVRDWGALFGQLFVKYRDGYVITENKEDKSCGCEPVAQSYSQPWFDRIAVESGDHFAVPAEEGDLKVKRSANLLPVSKKSLRALK
eukprot:gene27599-34344_t